MAVGIGEHATVVAWCLLDMTTAEEFWVVCAGAFAEYFARFSVLNPILGFPTLADNSPYTGHNAVAASLVHDEL